MLFGLLGHHHGLLPDIQSRFHEIVVISLTGLLVVDLLVQIHSHVRIPAVGISDHPVVKLHIPVGQGVIAHSGDYRIHIAFDLAILHFRQTVLGDHLISGLGIGGIGGIFIAGGPGRGNKAAGDAIAHQTCQQNQHHQTNQRQGDDLQNLQIILGIVLAALGTNGGIVRHLGMAIFTFHSFSSFSRNPGA